MLWQDGHMNQCHAEPDMAMVRSHGTYSMPLFVQPFSLSLLVRLSSAPGQHPEPADRARRGGPPANHSHEGGEFDDEHCSVAGHNESKSGCLNKPLGLYEFRFGTEKMDFVFVVWKKGL